MITPPPPGRKKKKPHNIRRGHEPPLYAPAARGVRRGDDAHADVVRHVAAHLLAAVAAAARRREVKRLYKAPAPKRAERFKVTEVAYAALGVEHKGEEA